MRFSQRIKKLFVKVVPLGKRFSTWSQKTGTYLLKFTNLKRPEAWLSTFTSLLLRIGAILLLFSLLVFLWRMLNYEGYTIQQFNVPKTLADNGFDGTVIARQLEDQYLGIKRIAVSIKEDSIQAIGDEQQPELNVDVLGVGLSLRSIGFHLRDLFGRENNMIRGEITQADENLALTLRMSGANPEVIIEPLDQGLRKAIDGLLGRGAELILQNTDPYRLAIYCHHKGAFDQGEEVVKKMLVERPLEEHWAYLAWGTLLENEQRYQEALEKFELSILAKSDFPLALQRKGWALMYLDRQDEAIAVFDEATRLKPDEPGYWNSYATVLHVNEQYEASDQAFKKASELDPTEINWLFNWADKKIGRGEVKEARAIMEMAVERAEKNDDFLNRTDAKFFIASLDQDSASICEHAKVLLSARSDNAFTILSVTRAYFSINNYEEVIRAGKMIIPLQSQPYPKQPIFNYMAMAYNFIREPDSAMVYVQRAIAINPDAGYPYSTLAETHHYLGDRDQFFQYLELSLEKGMDTKNLSKEDQPYDLYWNDPVFQDLMKKYSKPDLKG